jgi:hypothetical protein
MVGDGGVESEGPDWPGGTLEDGRIGGMVATT